MIEIKGLGSGMPIPPEEVDRERLKEIKSRTGKIAFARLFSEKGRIAHVSQGIARSEGALKWIFEVINEEKWKGS